jgi:hypothetical protein
MKDKRYSRKWENIGGHVDRLKIYGGWLVCAAMYNDENNNLVMSFVPDPNHEWELEEEVDNG